MLIMCKGIIHKFVGRQSGGYRRIKKKYATVFLGADRHGGTGKDVIKTIALLKPCPRQMDDSSASALQRRKQLSQVIVTTKGRLNKHSSHTHTRGGGPHGERRCFCYSVHTRWVQTGGGGPIRCLHAAQCKMKMSAVAQALSE